MTARPEIVAVLTSLDLEHSDLVGRRLFHLDGRPFTPDETELFFDATAEDLEAAAIVSKAVADQAQARRRDWERLTELCSPHITRGGRLIDALPLMPPADRAEAEEIMARLSAAH